MTLVTLLVSQIGLPQAQASPGGDATIVVSSGTIDVAGARVLTGTTMCPPGTRATGGGAYPVTARAGGSIDTYRISYSAPVDETGLASHTGGGDVPRGWQVTIGVLHSDTSGDMRFYAVCSAIADAVIAENQPAGFSGGAATASCPVGSRAVGGGVGKVNDTVLDSSGPLIWQSGPVDATGTVAGTGPGDAATGWRTSMAASEYGNRFFAVCSASADATVASTSFTLAKTGDGPNAGFGTATCPLGARALSAGVGVDGDDDSLQQNRVSFVAPVSMVSSLSSVASGATSRSALIETRASNYGPTTYRVFLICATEPPPDTTAPNGTIDKGPRKKTFARKATFRFSAEPGATFTCQLDKKAAKPCSSPYKVKRLTLGKHKVSVVASDAAGNADPTPATYRWKVKKKPTSGGCTGECRSDGYVAYVACAAKSAGKPKDACDLGDTPVAVLVSPDHDATYKICVRYPSGRRLCAAAQHADKGKKATNTITSNQLGKHKVTWRVGGVKVGTWKFVLRVSRPAH